MNERHKLKTAYSDWFSGMIVSALQSDDALKGSKQLMFVTVTFKRDGQRRRRFAEGEPLGQAELQVFKHLYNRVCRQLIGRNFHRASYRSLLPCSVAFLDAEGSRFWRAKGEFDNLHIHSLWVINGDQVDAFDETIRHPIATAEDRLVIDGVDVQRIDVTAFKSIVRVTSYASKLVGFNIDDLTVGSDFLVFPMEPGTAS